MARSPLGQYASNTVNVVLQDAPAFAYDVTGNLLTFGTRYFEYDPERRLTAVTEPNLWRCEFLYDGQGRRRVCRDCEWLAGSGQWGATNEIRYAYDGEMVIQERHFDPRLTNTTPQQIVTYTRGLDLSGTRQGAGGIGGVLARSEQTSTTPALGTHAYYHSDRAGNVIALVNEQRLAVARYLYDPFGTAIDASGPLADANTLRYSGKEWHRSSGLLHFGRRDYDPNLQRWLTQDPIGEAGGINLYGFVGNNPINYVDPHGLLGWEDWINPLNWFTSEFWGEVLNSAAASKNPQPLDPNSNRALLNDEGLTPGTFTDRNGNQISAGQVTAMVGGAVIAGTLVAMTDGAGNVGKGAECAKLSRGAKRTLGNLTDLADKTGSRVNPIKRRRRSEHRETGNRDGPKAGS